MCKEIKYISSSKKGIRRTKNQDRVLILNNNEFILFIVFDGVSSYEGSFKYIEAFKKEIRSNYRKSLNESGDGLSELFFETNKNLLELSAIGKSTASILFISKKLNIAKYINIGDSRIYIYSDQFLEKVTIDDAISNTNILTRYLGSENLILEDFKVNNIDKKNNFLICTDGFYSLMNKNLKEFFITFNFKLMSNIRKKLAFLQRKKNIDDSTYILIRNEILH